MPKLAGMEATVTAIPVVGVQQLANKVMDRFTLIAGEGEYHCHIDIIITQYPLRASVVFMAGGGVQWRSSLSRVPQ
jgi:hypothetical protein